VKRLLLIGVALVALTSGANALTDEVTEKLYRLGPKVVRMWTDNKGSIEIRLIPGWQLDPKCPESRWGEDECNGGQGFLLFHGTWWNGTARLDRDGCDEAFAASVRRTNDGGLALSPVHGPAKCKATFKPENTGPRR
jgi:hypothetical protein